MVYFRFIIMALLDTLDRLGRSLVLRRPSKPRSQPPESESGFVRMWIEEIIDPQNPFPTEEAEHEFMMQHFGMGLDMVPFCLRLRNRNSHQVWRGFG